MFVNITKTVFLQNLNLRRWLKETNTSSQILRIEDFEYEEGLKPIYNICHRNVDIAVEVFGGRVIPCYEIKRYKSTCYIKQAHSIWEDATGVLRDITPDHPQDNMKQSNLVGFPANAFHIDIYPRLISPCYVKKTFEYDQILNSGMYKLQS